MFKILVQDIYNVECKKKYKKIKGFLSFGTHVPTLKAKQSLFGEQYYQRGQFLLHYVPCF